MPTFLLYSLKAAGCLAVFYLFYKLLLSRDTLHRMNRVLLCGVLLLSFLLPLCVITVEKELPGVSAAGIDVIPENYFRRDMVFENRIPDDTRDLMITEEPEPAPEPFDWGVLLGIIYFAGVFATLGWTVCNIVRVVRMTRRGQRIPLGNGSVLVLSDRIRAPFSWMRYVVMSEEDYACGGGTILVHEQAHQRLGHSWDLLLVDLLGCLQWFNPAMWLLRVELRAVHEYEADEQVLRCGVDAKDYQMLLIKKAVGGRWYSIANSLNHSNLKNRITMMLRKRSSRWARAKALYVLPLACLALGAFAQTSYVLLITKLRKIPETVKCLFLLVRTASQSVHRKGECHRSKAPWPNCSLISSVPLSKSKRQNRGRTPLPDAYLAGTISLGPVMSLFAAAAGGL